MKILILGGTRFFGVHTVNALIEKGHDITVATRGSSGRVFGDRVTYLTVDRLSAESMRETFSGVKYDVVIDKIAYCSDDIKNALDVLQCDKYIYMSTTAVYRPKHDNTVEEDYLPENEETVWCKRSEFIYDEVKRQAENALYGKYKSQNSIAVRYPFVIGEDDYTQRLRFYVEHTIKGIPMYIDNFDCQMGFIGSREAGEFMAYLVDADYSGPINGASVGTVSVADIVGYVEKKCTVKAILSKDGDPAPYNDTPSYTINTDRAKAIGYTFSNLNDWIYKLIDHYIEQID